MNMADKILLNKFILKFKLNIKNHDVYSHVLFIILFRIIIGIGLHKRELNLGVS